jgi:hypothetical protein
MPSWKKLVVSGSDATLNSLQVTNNVTAAAFSGSFSGSFEGDGSGLTNLTVEIAEIASFPQTFTNTSSVVVNHDLDTSYPLVQVYNEDDEQIIPLRIKILTANSVQVDFSSNQTGYVIVAKGGHIISGTASNSALLEGQPGSYYLDYNNFTNIPPSGDSFPYTGSAIISGSLDVIGPLTATTFVGVLSSSAQIASEISGAFTSVSQSIASDIAGLVQDSGSFSTRITDLEQFSSSADTIFVSETEFASASGSFLVTGSVSNDTVTLVKGNGTSFNLTVDNVQNATSASYASFSETAPLDQLIGTVFSASNFTFPQDLTVQGRLTAQEFYTELVSSSVLFESGSTKFGDSLDDTHQFTGSVRINGPVSSSKMLTDSIVFRTGAGVSVGVGELAWNNSDGTLDLGMKGGNVVQQIGQEIFYEVRNATGDVIKNGTALYASGVTVGSGRIEAAPYTADGSIREIRFLGLATENINNSVNGLVTHFGYVRGLDTRGTAETPISVGDENWQVGDILYVHPTAAGKLTNIPPKHKIYAAIVINRNQNAGVLFVRSTSYGHIDDIHDIAINTGSLSTGDLLVYDASTDDWKNTKTLSGSYQINNGNLTITGSLNVTNSITGSSISATSGFTGSLDGNASTATSASHAVNADTASLANFATTAGTANTASYVDFSNIDNVPDFLLESEFNTYTGSVDTFSGSFSTRITSLESFSASLDSDFVSETEFALASGSFLTTGSVSGDTITLTKGDGSTFNLTVDNVNSASFATTASYVDWTDIDNIPVGIVSSSAQIASDISGSFTSVSQSIASDIAGLVQDSGSFSTRISSLESFSASLDTNFVSESEFALASGSFLTTGSISNDTITLTKGDGSTFNLIVDNVQNATSASFALTASYLEGYISPFPYTGSAIITGSLEVIGGTVSGSFIGDGSGLTGVVTTIESQTSLATTFTTASTVTVNHVLNTLYPLVQVYTDEDEQIIPERIKILNSGSVQVDFSSPQSGYIVIAKGGHIVSGSVAVVQISEQASYAATFTSVTTTTVNHNLSAAYPIVQVYDTNDEQLIPQKIRVLNSSSVQVDFSQAESGYVVVAKGGHIISGTVDSLDGQPGSYYLDYNNFTNVPAGIVSSSTQLNNSTLTGMIVSGSFSGSFQGDGSGLTGVGGDSFPYTGSAIITGSLEVIGTFELSDVLFKTVNKLLTSSVSNYSVFALQTGSLTAGFFDYTVNSGSNARMGTLQAVWVGNTVSLSETSTDDIGNTSDVDLNVIAGSGEISLRLTTPTPGWKIKTIARLL